MPATSSLDYSSVPVWARVQAPADPAEPFLAGRSYLVVGVGEDAAAEASAWARRLGHRAFVAHGQFGDPGAAGIAAASDYLRDRLAESAVGVRVLLFGPVGACLALRAVAGEAGLEDDEWQAIPCGDGPIRVHCPHCAGTLTDDIWVGDHIPCPGCGAALTVAPHVSRRTGEFLGLVTGPATAGGTP